MGSNSLEFVIVNYKNIKNNIINIYLKNILIKLKYIINQTKNKLIIYEKKL